MQKRDLTAFDVVKAYYGTPHKNRQWKVVMGKLGVSYSRATSIKFRKMLEDYEDEKKLVTHSINEEDPKFLRRESDIEEAVRSKYPLRSVIVVNTDCLISNHEKRTNVKNSAVRIHRELGYWGGKLISATLRTDDSVGIGGGRCLHFSAQNTSVIPGNRHRGAIHSLTGQIGPGTQLDDIDADYVAGFLYAKLQSQGALKLLGCSIADPKRRHSKNEVDTSGLRLAVTGIGALDEGHRWKQYENNENLVGVKELLGEINKLSTLIETEYRVIGNNHYYPVGDICNWGFVVEPPAQSKNMIPDPKFKRLEKLLTDLNKKLLNTSPEALAKVASGGAVIAVAGGRNKAGAIVQILRKGKERPWITHLVTDIQVAEEILKVEESI